MEGSENQPIAFIKKREQFTVGIRRQNRQQLISKRRNLGNQDSNELGDDREIDYIVDPRYEEYTKKLQKIKYNLQNLPDLLKAIYNSDILKQHEGAIGIRRIMSLSDNPPIQAIIDSGVIPRLLEFVIQQQYPQLQLQATWALANVASGNQQQCQSLINKGAIDLFVHLVKSPHLGIVQQAIWAIGNIASDSIFNRDALIRKGAINNIIYSIHHNKKLELVQPSLWALSNLCRGTPLPNYESIKQGVFIIAEFLPRIEFKDDAVFADCCWAICYNFPKKKSQYERIINRQFIQKIVTKLNSYDFSLLIPVIRVIGHITKINNDYIDVVLQQPGILQSFYQGLGQERKLLRLETCWVLSNIASSNQNHINKLLECEKLIQKLLQLFERDLDDIKKQLCYLFANLTVEGNPEIIFQFFKQVNIMKYYILALVSQDSKLIEDSLENIYEIFKLGQKVKGNGQNPFIRDLGSLGGFQILEELQLHENQDIYKAVVRIMKDFFEIEDALNL